MNVSLTEKIRNRENGIVFYGMTPPKVTHTQEEIAAIAHKQIERIRPLDIDGIVLYDIQDEADRTDVVRPFPYIETVEPTKFAQEYLSVLECPVVIYKAVGKHTHEELEAWLESRKGKETLCVFVGAASKDQQVHTTVRDAYALKKTVNPELCLGGIAIPERHMAKLDEHLRVYSKIENGCEFFVTQAVYNLEASKKFLDDYVAKMKVANMPLVPVIFTITPCGSVKTLEFMKWLGISVPDFLADKLTDSDDILHDSVMYVRDIFKELYVYAQEIGIPVGCNVESVSIRKAEIDASIELLEEVKRVIRLYTK